MSKSTAPSIPPRGSGLSLYANLLEPGVANSASISKAPVVFKNGSTESDEPLTKKPQIDAATLRFQPTRRPQLASTKPKPKSTPKPPSGGIPIQDTPPPPAAPALATVRASGKSTLADWATVGDDADVNGFYEVEKRQRGGRKRRKKNKEEHIALQDWEDIYDPARPNNYEEYKNSDEKIREVREWKELLYRHRRARRSPSDQESDEEESSRPRMGNQFAPPSQYSFAPPPMDTLASKPVDDRADSDSYSPKLSPESIQPPLPPPPPPPLADSHTLVAPMAPVTTTAAISRAPVRYNLPPTPSNVRGLQSELEQAMDLENVEEEDGAAETEDAPRSNRPGQKGFAERLMSKYGWSKGTGLGADGSGIINPLKVVVEKRKKKSDAEGGGFRDSGGRGKIVGGKKNVPENDSQSKFGPLSEVVVLRGMVDGMDLDEEVGDGGLMQEIGDECAEKYGRVERVFIHRHGSGPTKVFVKFTSQVSALGAVNALEGRVFNGNTISALYYDAESFEKGVYE